MDTGKLNRWISLGANIGVLLGIVFLAIELRQNNELLAAEARFNRLSVILESATVIVENGDLAEIFWKVEAGQSLTPVEQVRIDYFLRRVFSVMQWTYFELSESNYPMERWRAIVGQPIQRAYWLEHKSEFTYEFAEFIDTNFFEE